MENTEQLYPYRFMRIKRETKQALDQIWPRGVKLDDMLMRMIAAYKEKVAREQQQGVQKVEQSGS